MGFKGYGRAYADHGERIALHFEQVCAVGFYERRYFRKVAVFFGHSFQCHRQLLVAIDGKRVVGNRGDCRVYAFDAFDYGNHAVGFLDGFAVRGNHSQLGVKP